MSAQRAKRGGWKGGRERNGPCFFVFFSLSLSSTLCVPRLKTSSSFQLQWSKVHVWGSLCQAWAGPGDEGALVTEKLPVLNSRPGTARGWFLHYQAMWYVNVIGLNRVRGCLSLLDRTWHASGGGVMLAPTRTRRLWRTRAALYLYLTEENCGNVIDEKLMHK